MQGADACGLAQRANRTLTTVGVDVLWTLKSESVDSKRTFTVCGTLRSHTIQINRAWR